MKIQKISTKKLIEVEKEHRPSSFNDFIGQDDVKKVIQAAISSAHKRKTCLGHILFSGESGYGKTTLAKIVAKSLGVNIKIITGYALSKPSELISVLNSLEENDILFIDEIHRLKANIEEILYIAMEDFAIDMVMPEGGNVRVSIKNFTLIGATTKLESLSRPLKNRFVYKFHFMDYNSEQVKKIICKYLDMCAIRHDPKTVEKIHEKIVAVPREIKNFCIKLRDYLIAKGAKEGNLIIDKEIWKDFEKWAMLIDGGLTHMHQRYLDILNEFNGGPVSLKTISLKLGLNEKAVEEDVEQLLLKLGMIEKTTKGRILR